MFVFSGLIYQKKRKNVLLVFVAGHHLVGSEVEQVGTLESLRAGVCDGDNLLGNVVSLFEVFLCVRVFSRAPVSLESEFPRRVAQHSGSIWLSCTEKLRHEKHTHTHAHTIKCLHWL